MFWTIFALLAGFAFGFERYLERQFEEVNKRLYDIEKRLKDHWGE